MYRVRRVFVLAACGSCAIASADAGAPPPSSPTVEVSERESTLPAEVVERLVKMGWRRDTAAAVVDLNARYFTLLHEADPEGFRREIGLYGRLTDLTLGRSQIARIQQRLKETPSLAGLLVGSLDVANDAPTKILDAIPTDDPIQAERTLSLFVLHSDPAEALALAERLRDPEYLTLSDRMNASGLGEAAFILNVADLKEEEARRIYFRWVRDLIDDYDRVRPRDDATASSADLDDAAAVRTVLTLHADAVRRRLKVRPEFRRRFLSEIWPQFREVERTVRHDGTIIWTSMFPVDTSAPTCWDLLERESVLGPELLTSQGAAALILLDDRLKPDGREQAERVRGILVWALRHPDEGASILNAVCQEPLLGNPAFAALLARPIPATQVENACQRTLAKLATGKAGDELDYLRSLPDATLIAELAPEEGTVVEWVPGGTVILTARKALSGRRVSDLEIAFAVWDAVDSGVMLATVGQSVVVTRAVTGGGKGLVTGSKILAQEGAEATVERIARDSAETLAAKGVESIAKKEPRWWLDPANTDLLFNFPALMVRKAYATAGLKDMVEITPTVRSAFEGSKVGNRTFKRITGLDARIFMRNDRLVAIDVPKAIDSPLGRALNETALNAGFDTSIQAEPGQRVIHAVVGAGAKANEILRPSKESQEALQRNWAAWLHHVALHSDAERP